jgi:LmbE family N-acetylglucosaminyl deacetylase
MKRVLIVAAHPDDEVLGCGGLIAKLRPQGVEFKVVFVGEGSSCRYDSPEDPRCGPAIHERNAAAVRALGLLQVQQHVFHDLPCGRFDQVPIITINKIIEAAVASFAPDTVLTHSPHDANNDHRIVFRAAVMATRPGARNHVARLLSFEILSSSEWSYDEPFKPSWFVELSEEQLARKWQALAAYDSEVRSYPFPRSAEGVRALAMMRGMQSGVRYAEAYQLVREFVR